MPSAVTSVGFVMLIAVGAASRLVLTDATGRVQTRELPGIAAGRHFGFGEGSGLVVDRARLVAYALGARAPVAEIDLRTMRVRRHRIRSAPRVLTVRGCRACGADLTTVRLDDARLAVAGFRLRPSGPVRRRLRPAGAAVIDTRSWTARTIAPRAGAVVRAGDDLLVFDGRQPAGAPGRGSACASMTTPGASATRCWRASPSATSRSQARACTRGPGAACTSSICAAGA